jgi:hypothetical protein
VRRGLIQPIFVEGLSNAFFAGFTPLLRFGLVRKPTSSRTEAATFPERCALDVFTKAFMGKSAPLSAARVVRNTNTVYESCLLRL